VELQRREFLKLVGTAAVASSAFGVVHVASASEQAVTLSGERVVPVMCGAWDAVLKHGVDASL
jgi:anaerobic selenocysteine-containing dehydrogenase